MADIDQFHYADRQFYAPWRVRHILRSLRYPLARPPKRDNESAIRGQRPSADAWLEERLCERADVLHALCELPWFSRAIVFKAFIDDETDSHLATILRCDRETVRCHKIDGIDWMARRLGWLGEAEAPPQRSPQVWRNPKLGPQ